MDLTLILALLDCILSLEQRSMLHYKYLVITSAENIFFQQNNDIGTCITRGVEATNVWIRMNASLYFNGILILCTPMKTLFCNPPITANIICSIT